MMKRVLLAMLGLLVMSGAAFAQPDTSYVGLFADVDHTTWDVLYVGPSATDFTMYIFWLPSVRGLQGVEFKVKYPSNVLGMAVTSNPSITLDFGSLSAGILSVWGEGDCQQAGVWVESHNQECLLRSNVASMIEIVAHPTSGKIEVATCELGYPLEPVRKFTNLCTNQACVTATETKTWGAIKGLYKN